MTVSRVVHSSFETATKPHRDDGAAAHDIWDSAASRRLYEGVHQNQPLKIQAAIDEGISPMQRLRGLTPLTRAARCGHKDAINALIAAGALPDNEGAKPVVAALESGHVEAAEVLLAEGASYADVAAYMSTNSLSEEQLRAVVKVYFRATTPAFAVLQNLCGRNTTIFREALTLCDRFYINNNVLPWLLTIDDRETIDWLWKEKKIRLSVTDLPRDAKPHAVAALLLSVFETDRWPELPNSPELSEASAVVNSETRFLWKSFAKIHGMLKALSSPYPGYYGDRAWQELWLSIAEPPEAAAAEDNAKVGRWPWQRGKATRDGDALNAWGVQINRSLCPDEQTKEAFRDAAVKKFVESEKVKLLRQLKAVAAEKVMPHV